jgi:hypothetical protein
VCKRERDLKRMIERERGEFRERGGRQGNNIRGR